MRGDGAGNLRNLNGVREPVAKVIGITASKDLRLGFKAAKSARVDDAVTIPLKIIAVRMRGLGVTASMAAFHVDGEVGEHEASLAGGKRGCD